MATSAIGPGFLTQTTVFTQQLAASFGFVILISVLLDIGAQLNIWRILTVSGYRAQDLANALLPGLGYMLAALGGNRRARLLTLPILVAVDWDYRYSPGMDTVYGAFAELWYRAVYFLDEGGRQCAGSVYALAGILMVLLTLYVAISSHPPMVEAVRQSVWPAVINTKAIVTW